MSNTQRNAYMRVYSKKYRKDHPKQQLIYQRRFVLTHPWYRHYRAIQARCSYPNHSSYRNYGGKGIKNNLTLNQLEDMWFRDRAYLMKNPSVDRLDSDKDYDVFNCRFIELRLNLNRKNKS